MAITVFDAVGRFTADTSELDRFIAKLERGLTTAEEKAAAAAIANKNAQNQLRDAFKSLNAEGGNTADNQTKYAEALKQSTLAHQAASRAGVQLKDSLGIVKESTREARGEAQLLGEAIGVHLPRHVNTFLAEIPGVANVLKGAFAVTAIGFLIDALIQIPDKVKDIAASLAGWTEEAKKAYDAQIKLNATFLDRAEKREIEALRENERGLKGIELTQRQHQNDQLALAVLDKRIQKDGQLVAVLEAQKQKLKEIQGIVPPKVDPADWVLDISGKIAILDKQIDSLNKHFTDSLGERDRAEQQSKDRSAQLRQQGLDDFIKTENAKAEARKREVDAEINIGLAGATLELARTRITVFEEAQIRQQALDARYENDRQALEKEIANLEKDRQQNKDALIAKNAELDALEKNHYAQALANDANFLRARQNLIDRANAQLRKDIEGGKFESPIPDRIELSEDAKILVQVDDILARLGVTTAEASKKASEAVTAYDLLAQILGTGVQAEDLLTASTEAFGKTIGNLATDQLVALHAVLQKEIEATKAWGGETGNLETKLADVDNRLAHLGISLGKVTTLTQAWFKLVRTEAPTTQKIFRDLEAIGVKSFQNLEQSFQSAIASWILGQESLGTALRRALAQVLATIAAEAAMWGLYYTAWGIADAFWNPARAGADFAAAGEFFAVAAASGGAAHAINPSPNSGGSATPSQPPQAAAGSGQTPTQGPPNIQHFSAAVFPPSVVTDVGSGHSAQVIVVDRGSASRAAAEDAPATVINNHNHHWNFNGGVISADTVAKFAKVLSHAVKNNGVPLVSSEAHRVTRKS